MGRPATYWQCTPSTCVNSNFPKLVYNYDLAGDIASWVHPAGFTITNTISAARRVTQVSSSLNSSTQPPVLAQSITYTPWGALTSRTNTCVGTGCTNVVETYDYNNRMQPVRLQLGNSGNPMRNTAWCTITIRVLSTTPQAVVPCPPKGPATMAT